MTEHAETAPLRLRWEKKTRYYEAHVEQDLWGQWVFTRVWGRRNSRLGQIRRVPCQSYEDARRKLAGVERQRQQHGYQPVGAAGRAEAGSGQTGCP